MTSKSKDVFEPKKESTSYFTIVEEHESLAASYQLSVVWNVAQISSSDNADGYIVQKVDLDTDMQSAFKGIFPASYYEAWRVVDGKVDEKGDGLSDDYDDSFSYALHCEKAFIESLGRKGFAEYKAKVFWIPSSSEIFKEVDCWERGAVEMAGPIKSIRESDVQDSLDFSQCFVFERRFRHEFDLTQFEEAYDAFCNYLGNKPIAGNVNSERAVVLLVNSVMSTGVRSQIFRELNNTRGNELVDSCQIRKCLQQLSDCDRKLLFDLH